MADYEWILSHADSVVHSERIRDAATDSPIIDWRRQHQWTVMAIMANVALRMEAPQRGRVLWMGSDASQTLPQGLARAGFEAQSVAAEPEVFRRVANEAFDVVVIDLDLADVDGLRVVRRLQEKGLAASVVWLASDWTNELAARAAEAGVLQVLQKPVESAVLERVVEAGVNQTRHALSTLRAILRPSAPHHSVPATDAKNEFGAVLEAAVQDGAVVITKHDSPKAVLVSIERVSSVLARHEPDLQALTREFDMMVARMRTSTGRAAARGLFSAAPEQLGEAALAGLKKSGG